jgi:hypothetical protein
MLARKFYLKLLMSLLLTAFVMPQTWADELTVAEGTSKNAMVPVYPAYFDAVGTTGQVIYPKESLAEMAGKPINGVKFFMDNAISSGTSGAVLQVSLKEVDATVFEQNSSYSYDLFTDLTVCGTATIAGGESELTFDFDNPFNYSGNNLVVEVKVLTKSGYDSSVSFYGVSQTAGYNTGLSVYNQKRAQSFLPKATFDYTNQLQEWDAKVTPESLAFGKLNTGESSTLNVTITNKGLNAFTPSLSGLDAPFSTTYVPSELTSGESVVVPIVYSPEAEGSYTGTLTINCGDAGSFNVALSGTAVEPGSEIVVCDGTDKNGYVPVYGMYYDTKDCQVQFIYPASALTALNGREITGVKFFPENTIMINGGKLQLSIKETEQTVFERETAIAKPNEITEMTVAATIVPNGTDNALEFVFDKPFPYNGGNLAFETLVVEKSSYASGLKFLGQSQSAYTAFHYGNSSSNGMDQFLPKIEFASVKSGEVSTITVDPATVDVFTTKVGTPVTATVNVTGENLTGDITATVSGDDAFTAALENGVLTITYNPTAAGNHTATVTLSSKGAQNVNIALTGTATADYAVTISDNTGAHNYGNVLVNSSNVWTLTITNNGTKAVTPTLTGIEDPFSTTYTATALSAGESVTISINYAPTELGENSNTITVSFPEAGDAVAAYTCILSGKAVDSFAPTDENEVVKLVAVDKRSIYEPEFIDNANGNTTPQQLNCYDMRFKMAQPDDPAKRIKAGDLRPGNNLFEFYAIDDFGTEFRFATINLFAEGQLSSNPSVNAMDAPIKVTPSVEYYTEDGMPVHPTYSHNTTLNYTEKTYNDINELVDLEGVIDYVNDTWSANTATNSHPDHYNFQIRGVGQYGDMVTSLTAEYVESHMTGYGNQLVMPEGWERGSFAGPNNEASDDVHTFYYYDLYIKKSFFDDRGITGPVTVVVNTTLSGSGFNADNYKAMSVNGVEQIIAKEEFKDYSWTVPLMDEIPSSSIVEQVPMGVVIRLVSTGADFNRTTGIYIYGGGTGVSNVETVGIYKSSMNVKAYTQKQVDEDTDRNLVAMKVGNTETANADVNVLAYADPAVTGYKLNENSSASTTGMTQVATATHNENGSYTVNSVSAYNATYDFVRDESLGSIDGMWLPMYPADPSKYFLPVTVANGVGDDGVVRSNNNTYGSAMQQVEKNGSVDFSTSKCYKSDYTWTQDGVEYAIYSPEVNLTSELPAATGYELYDYRLWVDYDDEAPAWDFDENLQLIGKMERPLYDGQSTHIGGAGVDGRKDSWAFVAANDLKEVKLVARFYYKKTSTSNAPRIKARPTDSDRLYYVVEKQITIPMNEIVTGIDNVNGKAVAGVKYYNVAGVESDRPFQGVNIVVTRYTDGSTATRKVIK